MGATRTVGGRTVRPPNSRRSEGRGSQEFRRRRRGDAAPRDVGGASIGGERGIRARNFLRSKSFFEHLQQRPSHDTFSVDSGDVEKDWRAAGRVLRAKYTYPYQMHGSVGASVRRGRREAGPGDGVVGDAVGLSDAEHRRQTARICRLIACVSSMCADRAVTDSTAPMRFLRRRGAVAGGRAAGAPAVLAAGRDDVGKPRRRLRDRASGGAWGPDGIAVWDRESWVARSEAARAMIVRET